MGLALDEPNHDDIIETINGIVVATDPMVADHTRDIGLDMEEGHLVIVGNAGGC